MNPTITLVVTRGPMSGRKFAFSEPMCCTIGRSRECTIALPLEPEHLDVSRRHCLLEISPTEVRIRDLGSLNGTFVNDRKIGQRPSREALTDSNSQGTPAVELAEGDEVRLGEHTAFRVSVAPPSDVPENGRPRRASSGELPALR
jgi:pSer/pThr/pTyr-binding forkhead associated (FHA) protein